MTDIPSQQQDAQSPLGGKEIEELSDDLDIFEGYGHYDENGTWIWNDL